MADFVYVSRERMRELQEELHHLKTHGRAEVARKIAEARSHGDLSENADYDAALQEQELLEIRIAKLERILANAKVIDPSELPDDERVYLFSTVRLRNLRTNTELTFTLVSAEEADIEKNRLSVTSPLGKALLGKKVGEIAETSTPSGTIRYEILSIERGY
ncbi:MAG: transcription elongation factor GreA [Bacteroidota bacterium]|nr:transcription elongation factor GreA [Candidatus Kapabacteria bacterium]MCS7302020.1 transcription elongation factor GreA [Candidatus Kapabacteria bacterium]MCX7936820.1 transcription elongation factor GreA [Chlorobiota bacterium]MDW8074539.1 transcription elongation factor GreA [Bacteroidota bacterium]MDW8270985.1 transcription elongation factor GreA [Bacteroidota bacterium]